jgi:hypothetical protein
VASPCLKVYPTETATKKDLYVVALFLITPCILEVLEAVQMSFHGARILQVVIYSCDRTLYSN